MKWNSFNLISDSIQRTKNRLYPFNIIEWFKLIIVSLLSGSVFESRFSSNFYKSSGSENMDLNGIQNVIRDGIKKYWVVGGIIISILTVLVIILNYIQSVFKFIFIESLVNKKTKFSFKKNHSKGLSLFFFNFTISIMSLIFFLSLSFPYLYHFMKGAPIISSVGIPYIIFSIILFFIAVLILSIIYLFLYDFVVPYMYSKNVGALYSFKQVWKGILKNKLEVFVYWISRLLLKIGMVVISLLIIILLLIPFLLLSLMILGIGITMFIFLGNSLLFIILGIITGILIILIYLIMFFYLSLPFLIFIKYFQLLNFEKLTKIKLLQ